ncbi:hypothetical protein BDW59DRAFT_164788 [Aspergillus cavernicola]|uniref:Yeast cell wall synthesis Kre9/Knh1-like N-terminal domain-containing protein n=1 Tax=Aspergillus cavernicola TaxID=176166 RepID=A0ABR4HXF4_9EURO
MVRILLVALGVLKIFLVAANEFNIPSGGYEFVAGEPTTLSWDPSSGGTVTLELIWGSFIASDAGDNIASHLPNSGNYTWTVPADIPDLSDYMICLYPDQPPQDSECIPRFSIVGASNSTATPSATTSSSSSSESQPTPTASDNIRDPSTNAPSESLSTATKAGIGIGIGTGVVILVVVGIYCGRRRQLNRRILPKTEISASKGTMELDSYRSQQDQHELPEGGHCELDANTEKQKPSELPGRGLCELDRAMIHSDARDAVELPTIEHKFV